MPYRHADDDTFLQFMLDADVIVMALGDGDKGKAARTLGLGKAAFVGRGTKGGKELRPSGWTTKRVHAIAEALSTKTVTPTELKRFASQVKATKRGGKLEAVATWASHRMGGPAPAPVPVSAPRAPRPHVEGEVKTPRVFANTLEALMELDRSMGEIIEQADAAAEASTPIVGLGIVEFRRRLEKMRVEFLEPFRRRVPTNGTEATTPASDEA